MCTSFDATPFDETTRVLYFLRPLVEVDLPPFLNDFHHEIEVTLDWEAFVSTLAHSPHLSSMALHVWCMNFYETILSHMIL
jgi:hypothetical protein